MGGQVIVVREEEIGLSVFRGIWREYVLGCLVIVYEMRTERNKLKNDGVFV